MPTAKLPYSILFLLAAVPAAALQRAEAGEPELLLELFTSQSCYSCPPAEALLAEEYVGRSGLLALELHVDYWDDLIYGFAGRWKDRFSDPRFTKRQRRYAAALGERGVYTPQAVVQGASGHSGTARALIDNALEQASSVGLPYGWDVDFEAAADGGWQAAVTMGSGEAEAYVVEFAAKEITSIEAGENNGKVLANHNVVVAYEDVGRLEDGARLDIPAPAAGSGCAVILQRPQQGVVLGAWRCPA